MNFPCLSLWSLLLLVLTAHLDAGQEKFVLVEEGQSLAPIVFFEEAPPKTRRAAVELADYIEKTSGARPELIEGQPEPLPERAIWVGYQPVLETLFPDLDFDFQEPEEILIAANAHHLVIAGRDVWNPDHLEIPVRWDGVIEGRQLEYGTVNAVYTFLQDYLGVRWLWPGELGEDVLTLDTIAFAPFVHRYHPQLRFRNEVFYFSSLYRGRGSLTESGRWNRLQRLQLDSLYFQAGGHAFSNWWERFHETHPEYFALQPDGTRSGWPRPGSAKLCKSNPAVPEQWLADVEEQLKHDPNRTVFNAAGNDGTMAGHCVCPNCVEWDHPEGENRRFVWDGISQEYLALSDRHVRFANRCARLLKERFPDRDYYVMMHGYGHTRPAPLQAVPDENVIITHVSNSFTRPEAIDRGSPNETPARDQFREWSAVAPNIIWRPNVDDATGLWRGLPDVDFEQIADDYRFVTGLGAIGTFSALPQHWATQGPMYYLIAQLAWDPDQDADDVLEDYFQRGFGPAADELAAYWALMQKARRNFLAAEAERYSNILEVYDSALLAEAYGHLDAAAEAVHHADPVHAERVAFVRAGLDYLRLVTEIHHLMQRVEAGGADMEEAANRVRAKWVKIEELHESHPHALTWNWIRPDGERMRRLHPDH